MKDKDIYKTSLIDPKKFFNRPRDVLSSILLSKQQKIEVLKRWKHDALELEIAEDENMNADCNSDILDEVMDALRLLE